MKTEEAKEKDACKKDDTASMKYDELVIMPRGGQSQPSS